ncbi:CLUMA_CG003003, isoform A [Clunio marinus]|uniref:CLUMA_CG003003, isoform A n=1 Tax=Clunio marinus TaxID=568069 RepID=A0A1J1HPC5_9DIPT|nr:CLUMA_CG003003, isoform A [Clunio marinus]
MKKCFPQSNSSLWQYMSLSVMTSNSRNHECDPGETCCIRSYGQKTFQCSLQIASNMKLLLVRMTQIAEVEKNVALKLIIELKAFMLKVYSNELENKTSKLLRNMNLNTDYPLGIYTCKYSLQKRLLANIYLRSLLLIYEGFIKYTESTQTKPSIIQNIEKGF